MIDRLSVLLATGLHLSYIPIALGGRGKWTGAGFVGTLLGLAFVPFLPAGGLALWALLAGAAAAACWLCGRAERVLGVHDDPRIVLDEVVGLWTTVAFLPGTPRVWLAGFVVFRFFDSVKLPPYRWLERLPGGLGVVGDDVGAGIVSNLVLRAALALWPSIIY